jgi:RNA polymerase sigma-70 factor (ECF subfamily)
MNPKSSDAILGSAAEASIVALARAGDQPAFEELVRRRQSSIRNLLRRLCHDTALVDDLAQETFLQAWMHLGSLREPNAFAGWLRQLAINSWRQHLRRHRASGKPAEMEADDAVSMPATTERLDLDSALGALAPAVRLCIVLSYHEGMSHAEIVAATQLPLGTVKSHIARGTVRLRELLAAYYSSDEQSPDAR